LAAGYRHNPRCPAGYTYSAKHSDGDEAVAAFMKEAKAVFALGFQQGARLGKWATSKRATFAATVIGVATGWLS